ncbi:hypothetical protein GUJ93_ZPchr0007g5476 [Zizania palustris]|uniref:Uncharacterized protein n=1 Tax=Zizania palustris TaxID=103762 RepID=A0A8J5TAC4_ZIZPA|nr:hypothetical protein GUJ93_ZPchr0007g5476 [Zizania palustris]
MIMASVLLLLVALATATGVGATTTSMEERHSKWMAEHGRTYKDAAAKARRFRLFKANVEFIDRFNAAGDKRYRLGTNRFTDLTDAEFAAMYTGYKPSPPSPSVEDKQKLPGFMYANTTLSSEDSVDWRQSGTVADVQNQGSCGDCWAFSTVAAVEGINQISTGELVSLSEQQLLDAWTALTVVGAKAAISTAPSSTWPTAAVSPPRRPTPTRAPRGVPINSNMAVAIEGGGSLFRRYTTGVFTADSCGNRLDHAVTVVGYGTETDGSGAYWLIKNSWGTTWGGRLYI